MRKVQWIAIVVLLVFADGVLTSEAGWTQTGAGPYEYLATANWAGGTIDDDFPSTLTFTADQTVTFSNDYATAGLLNLDFGGAAKLILKGDGTADRTLTLGGDIDVDVGTPGGLNTDDATLGSSVANEGLDIDLGGSTRTIDAANGSHLVVKNAIGNGGLTKTGSGYLVLEGANTYADGTIINGGQLRIDGDTNLGDTSGNLSFDDGELATTTSFETDRDVTINGGGATFSGHKFNGTLTFNGEISGVGALAVQRSGFGNPIIVLTAANSYQGGTVLNNGNTKLELQDADAAGTGAIETGGTQSGHLRLRDDSSVTYGFDGIEKNAGAMSVDVDRLSSGSGETLTVTSLDVDAAANNDAQNVLNVTGANGYRLAIDQLNMNPNTPKRFRLLPTTANLTLGTVAMGNWDHLVLAGDAPDCVVTGAIASSVDNGDDTVGWIEKFGAGTWTLGGDCTYNGKTDVTNGILLINGSITPNANHGSVNVTGGALGGSGAINLASSSTVTVHEAASLMPGGTTNSVGTLSITGVLDLRENAVYEWQYASGTGGDLVQLQGDLVLPSVVTVNVTTLSAPLPGVATLIDTDTTLSGDTSGWVVTGPDVGPAARAVVDGTDVLLRGLIPSQGTTIIVR